MRHLIWVGCLVLAGSVSLVAFSDGAVDQKLKTTSVQSFNVNNAGVLTVRTRETGEVQVPDNRYENGSGVVLVIKRGVIVSIEMRGINVPVDSVAKARGKIILRGANLEKIGRSSELEVPAGQYTSQDPNDPPRDPQPQPDPGPRPQGFEVRDGAVVNIFTLG